MPTASRSAERCRSAAKPPAICTYLCLTPSAACLAGMTYGMHYAMVIAHRQLDRRVYDVLRKRSVALNTTTDARIDIASLAVGFEVMSSSIREAVRQSSEQSPVIRNRCEGDHAIHLAEKDCHDISAQYKALEPKALDNARVRADGPDSDTPHTPSTEALQSRPIASAFQTASAPVTLTLQGCLSEAEEPLALQHARSGTVCRLRPSADMLSDRCDSFGPQISRLSYRVRATNDQSTRTRDLRGASWSDKEVITERTRNPI